MNDHVKATIADTIDIAINEHLWDSLTPRRTWKGWKLNWVWEYSCHAVSHAVSHIDIDEQYSCQATVFLKSLGCDVYSSGQFSEFHAGTKRQYARALWLTWAAMIAREEGI